MLRLMRIMLVGLLTVSASAQCADRDGRLAPEIEQSLAMRRAWNVAGPPCEATIYVHSEAVHHLRSEQSTIACRDDKGSWSVTRLGQDGPGGLLQTEKRLTLQDEKKLTAEESRALDKLLSDQALYTEGVQRTGEIGVGASFHVMEIVSPNATVVARWNGRLVGKLGQVADIILGRG